MKRRSFLGLLGGAVVAPAVKAELETEVTSTTPEMNFSSGRQFSPNIPFAPYAPDKNRFAGEVWV